MGRSLSAAISSVGSVNGISNKINRQSSGDFGTGKVKAFLSSTTFVVPNGVTSLRARVWGAGGATNGQAGGTSSFGSHVSATGGSSSAYSSQNSIGGNGGTGVGGDVNANGGDGGGTYFSGSYMYIGGGGGAANLIGNGGRGANAINYISTGTSAASGGGGYQMGAGGLSMGGRGVAAGEPARYDSNTIQKMAVNNQSFFDIDLLGAGHGGAHQLPGVNGGGGGGSSQGGFPGGGGGGASYYGGGGGGGFAMKTINGLTPGDLISITVGLGGIGDYGYSVGGNGLVIVEW